MRELRKLAHMVNVAVVTIPTSRACRPVILMADNGRTTTGGLTMICGQVTSGGPMPVGPVCKVPSNSPLPRNVCRVIYAS